MQNLLYAKFSKVEELDDGTLKVFGIASSEAEDSDGETVKADAVRTALPDYLTFGAVREMHQPIAAGTAIEASVDADGFTHFGAHIVDESSVKKVRAGVLKGFSLGGKVTKRNKDNKKVIEGIKLTEISLVDRPANPDSVISLVKFDNAGAVVDDMSKVAERNDVNPKEGKEKYGNVAFADAKNKKYPIDTEEHIRAAWNYINKPKNAAKYSAADLKTIKGRIVSAWKRVIDKDGPPSATEKSEMSTTLNKSMWDVSRLASIIQDLHWLTTCSESERAAEGDDSEVPEQLKATCVALCRSLRDMVTEETSELLGLDIDADDEEILESASKCAKAILAGDLAKGGRKFSKATVAALGDMHKMATDLCEKFDSLGYKGADNPEDDDDMADQANKGAGSDALQKMQSDIDELKKNDELHKAEISQLKGDLEKSETARKAAEAERDELAKGVQDIIEQASAKGALKVVPKDSDTGDLGKGTGTTTQAKDDKPVDAQEEIRKSWKSPRMVTFPTGAGSK